MELSGKIRRVPSVSIGQDFFPVIFTHVGVTENEDKLADAILIEQQKITTAIESGTNIICDVSLNQNIKYIHEKMLTGLNVPFATVPIYETYIKAENNNLKADETLFLDTIKEQILRGADIITLHATIRLGDRDKIQKSKRLIPITSRGGVLMLELLEKNHYDNPYYTQFDSILKICHQYEVAISLGPSFRPGSVVDANLNDQLHLLELSRMGELTKRAQIAGVSIMIEGIGHASIDQIPLLIQQAKKLCGLVPYRIMAVSTDIAIGCDHISSAIASAVAIYHGADSITCVTRSEHIGLPALADIREAVLAAKIAAHSGYIARTGNYQQDKVMSQNKQEYGCAGNIANSLCSTIFTAESSHIKKSCSMCGHYCPIKKINS